jgi:hypothetical protein
MTSGDNPLVLGENKAGSGSGRRSAATARMTMQASPRDRRASRRNPVQVKLSVSDMRGSFVARTVDVSRGGLFAATTETRPVGSLLRMRVVGPRGESVLAVGVVVRCFENVETQADGPGSPGMAIALTSTSEAWDRFWDDVSATDDEGDS